MPRKILIITPVKDSIHTTLETIGHIHSSVTNADWSYIVYDDFSLQENAKILDDEAKKYNFELIHLKNITTTPSPNYLFILQNAQQKAIERNADLLIVESDVLLRKNTIEKMHIFRADANNPGMIAAVTVDENEEVNFPYLYARKFKKETIITKKRLSFCCTLLTNEFLHSFDFKNLNTDKHWFDVFISHKSVELGFYNYLLMNVPVLHKPHSSRPWKRLKYTNPLKYYWKKFISGRDKI